MARAQPDEAVRLLERAAQDYAAQGLGREPRRDAGGCQLARARARAGDLAGARADLEHAV